MKLPGQTTAVLLSMLIASASLGVAGCEPDGPIEDASEEVGDAIEDAGDEIEDAVDPETDER